MKTTNIKKRIQQILDKNKQYKKLLKEWVQYTTILDESHTEYYFISLDENRYELYQLYKETKDILNE